jgi:hypothetical protein
MLKKHYTQCFTVRIWMQQADWNIARSNILEHKSMCGLKCPNQLLIILFLYLFMYLYTICRPVSVVKIAVLLFHTWETPNSDPGLETGNKIDVFLLLSTFHTSAKIVCQLAWQLPSSLLFIVSTIIWHYRVFILRCSHYTISHK